MTHHLCHGCRFAVAGGIAFCVSLYAVATAEPISQPKRKALHNGIVLPEVWPPRDIDPESPEPMPVPYLVHPPEVIPVDCGRQLFVDDFLIERTDLERKFHQAEKYEHNPVFKAQTEREMVKSTYGGAQEATLFLGQGGVGFDPHDKVFKLFYVAGWRGGLALATSKDMVHWERPNLELAGDNLLLPMGLRYTGPELKTAGSDNCVWLDLNAPEAERIKFMTCWMHVPEEQRPDGFTHTLHVSNARDSWSRGIPTGRASDYCSFFFNPFRNVWVYSIKQNGPRGRCRYYAESEDFLAGADWTESVYWTHSDRLDMPEPHGSYPGAGETPQLYSLNAVAYESLLVGMHYIHRGPKNEICFAGNYPKLIDLELGFSRDGFHWHRPDRKGFIRAGRKEGTWDRGYMHSTAGVFVILDDRLVFPYMGTSGIAPNGNRGPHSGGSIGIATLRRDGFASMEAGDTPGTLITRPLVFSGGHLFVNLDAPSGSLRVAVLDKDGRQIESVTLGDCQPLEIDNTRAEVKWRGTVDLSKLAGKTVRLRFELTNGALYSFWVSRDATGRSDGYVASGGPTFPGRVDTVGNVSGRGPSSTLDIR